MATGERLDKEQATGAENPPLATVNIHLEDSLGKSKIKPGFLN